MLRFHTNTFYPGSFLTLKRSARIYALSFTLLITLLIISLMTLLYSPAVTAPPLLTAAYPRV